MHSSSNAFRFSVFEVDLQSQELRKNGRKLRLPPQAFRVLQILLSRAGQLVTREEIRDAIWNDATFVDFERSINKAVRQVREALADNADSPRFIETLPRRGYRFVADLQIAATAENASGSILENDGERVLANGAVKLESTAAGPHSWRARYALLCGVFMTSLIVIALRTSVRSNGSVSSIRVTRLVVANNAFYGVISPDGRNFLYATEDDQGQAIWIRQVNAPGAGTRLAGPWQAHIWGITSSPDGQNIYYVIQDEHDPRKGVLFRISPTGGDARKILEGVNGAPSFSPDGSYTVFKRFLNGAAVLVRATARGDNQTDIARSQSSNPFTSYEWTPDGTGVFYIDQHVEPSGAKWSIVEIALSGAGEKSRSAAQKGVVESVRWLNRSEVVAIMRDSVSARRQIWVGRSGRPLHRLTHDSNEYVHCTATSKGDILLASYVDPSDSLWIADMSDTAGNKQSGADVEWTPEYGNYDYPVWLPNGSIAYIAPSANGNDALWTKAPGKAERRVLTDPGNCKEPSVSGDGRTVVFVSNQDGQMNIWRITSDGTDAKQITFGITDTHPQISADGNWVAYASKTGGQWAIWKIRSDGSGHGMKLADSFETSPVISPDGKLVAYEGMSERDDAVKIHIRSFESGVLIRELNLPAHYSVRHLKWTRNGAGLTFVRYANTSAQIWFQPLSGEAPSRVGKDLPSDLNRMDWSWDGKRVVYERNRTKTGFVLISNFH